jgi:hypothetical protein
MYIFIHVSCIYTCTNTDIYPYTYIYRSSKMGKVAVNKKGQITIATLASLRLKLNQTKDRYRMSQVYTNICIYIYIYTYIYMYIIVYFYEYNSWLFYHNTLTLKPTP